MDFITYFRTSSKTQLLGIEAQRATATNYVASQNGRIVAEYWEHCSGKLDTRQELQKAIDHCKRTGATLLIAKLDRLSRHVPFLFTLKEELDRLGLKAVVAEMPELMTNTLILGIMASLAQAERELIAERTRAALEVKKAQGVKLGRPKGTDMSAAYTAAAIARRQLADEWAESVYPVIRRMHQHNVPLKTIATSLNEQGIPTRRGGVWTATAVKRVITRCAQ